MMRKRVQITLAMLLVVLAGAITWQSVPEPEPVYQGKPLSFWLNEVLDGDSINHEAFKAVRNIGTNAIPLLLQRLQTKDSAFKVWLIGLERKHSLIKTHLTPAWVTNLQGLIGIQALAPQDAKVALPELLQLLNEPRHANFPYLAGALLFIDNEQPESWHQHEQRELFP